MPDQKNGTAPKRTKLSKKDAVRKALATLGSDAMPTRIRSHVKEKYGIDMNLNHISTGKHEILSKKKGKGAVAKTVASPKQAAQAPTPATAKPAAAPTPATKPHMAAPQANGSASVSLGDIEVVKGLVGRVGPAGLK